MPGHLNIIAAVYGLQSVTTQVTNLINMIPHRETLSFVVNDQNLGGDTWPGHEKSLTVVYNYDGGTVFVATATENSTLNVTGHALNKLLVAAATWGPVDVTGKVNSMISTSNTLSFVADSATFGDTWPNVQKTLVLVLDYNSLSKSVNVYTESQSVLIDLNNTDTQSTFPSSPAPTDPGEQQWKKVKGG